MCGCLPRYFYPRSPCGERLANLRGLYSEAIFLSTLSLRRATRILSTSRAFSVISIHALLAESDRHYYYICNNRRAFLSTLSLRRATVALCGYERAAGFLSTLSLRRATYLTNYHFTVILFLSTLSLRRATALDQYLNEQEVFLSTLSLRRATEQWRHPLLLHIFLSTLSLRRATRTGLTCGDGQNISIHALLAESDIDDLIS